MNRDPDWAELDRRCVWHPFTQMKTAPAPIPIERGEGVWLFTSDGRRLLDGVSSWWVNIHGHSHPRMNAAISAQMEKVEQVIFAGFTHEPASRLAAELVDRTPGDLGHVFYSDDGSTAVEVGMKMAAQWWAIRGETERDTFVAFELAYHGDTFGAMAAGGVAAFHSSFQPFFCRVERAPCPYAEARTDEEMDTAEDHCERELERIFDERRGKIAGLILEPMVQGAGGMLIWRAPFVRRVADLCQRHGVPLIADEVFTGFGRTGRMFACEHAAVVPDILCVSKAISGGYMPLGATLCSDEIYEGFLSDDRAQTFFHGHSYTANPLSCAAGVESLKIFDDERYLDRIGHLEGRFQERLTTLASHDRVAHVRSLGGLAVLELEGSGGYFDDIGPRVAKALFEREVLLRPLGNVLYFLPPYVITDEEIDFVFDSITAVLDEL
ncbi:MAG: adenosylmethionine--8-amino-7-oxononanoate transaminase [Planctomycetota bacterium]